MSSREYHYVMTIQWPTGPDDVATLHTHEGTYTSPTTGGTRQQAYRTIRDYVIQAAKAPHGRAMVVFFDLQPNQLDSLTPA